MKSRASCFEPAVFRRGLKTTAPLWGIYLFFLIMVLPVRLLSNFSGSQMALSDISLRCQSEILDFGLACAHIIAFVYGLAAAWLLFHWLFRTNTAYFYASLPVRRETLFCTNYLTGLIISLGPNLICALLTLGATALLGLPLPLHCLEFAALATLGFLFFFSFAVFLCVITGQMAVQPIVYVILNFTVYVVASIVAELLGTFVYGMAQPYVDAGTIWGKLSPLVYLMSGRDVYVHRLPWDAEAFSESLSIVFEGWGVMLILALAGIVFAAVGFLLLRKRDMERSGDVIAFRWLKPAFLYAVTLGSALVIGFLLFAIFEDTNLSRNFWSVLLFMLAGALIGNLAARMMLQKSIHVLKSGWLSYGICCLVLLLGFGAARLDLFGYVSYVPKQEQVAAVMLVDSPHGQTPAVSDPQVIADVLELHQQILDTRQTQADRITDIRSGLEGIIQKVSITYLVDRGGRQQRLERTYQIPVTPELEQSPNSLWSRCEAILNSEPMVMNRVFGCEDPVFTPTTYSSCRLEGTSVKDGSFQELYLTQAQTYEFLQSAILPDLKTSMLGRDALNFFENGAAAIEWTGLSLQLISNTAGQSAYLSVPEDAQNVVQYMRKLGLVSETARK